jgi:hypothetical protein
MRVSVLLLSVASVFADTCTFSLKNEACPTVGQSCKAKSTYVCDSGARAGGSAFQSAFCLINSGTNSTNFNGIVSVSPTFESAYRSPCSMSDRFGCQHADNTLMGQENFPGLLTCSGGLQCIMYSVQEVGDPCSSNTECISGLCTKGICTGMGNQQPCLPGGCAAGLYCEYARGSYLCQQLAPLGAPCSSFGQCAVGSTCNLAESSPSCTAFFSAPVGTYVNTPDLCASGLSDDSGACSDFAPPTALGSQCTCGQPTGIPGTSCHCAFDGQCRVREATFRTANIVNSRKAARACFATATAPDGTPCS